MGRRLRLWWDLEVRVDWWRNDTTIHTVAGTLVGTVAGMLVAGMVVEMVAGTLVVGMVAGTVVGTPLGTFCRRGDHPHRMVAAVRFFLLF